MEVLENLYNEYGTGNCWLLTGLIKQKAQVLLGFKYIVLD